MLLADRGDAEALRALADTGNNSAAEQLVEFLVKRGDVEGLQLEVGAGTSGALEALRDLTDSTTVDHGTHLGQAAHQNDCPV